MDVYCKDIKIKPEIDEIRDEENLEETESSKQKKYHRHSRSRRIEMNRQTRLLLQQENERLRAENIHLRQAMTYPSCSSCHRPVIPVELMVGENELRQENARFRTDIERLRCLARTLDSWSRWFWTRNGAPSSVGSSSGPAAGHNRNLSEGSGAAGPSWLNLEILAVDSVNEVAQMASIGGPVWTRTGEGDHETLNLEEYQRKFFPNGARRVPGIVREASRATGLVSTGASSLLRKLMDSNWWTEIFPSIVAVASTEKVISNGAQGIRNLALQMMNAEFLQVVSPLIPTRQVKFLRCCKQMDKNTWVVADFSPDFRSNRPNSQSGFTRFPSGYVVQSMNKDSSKVIILEHWEYEETAVPNRFRAYLCSGLGFGARRWLTALQREGFSSSMPLPALRGQIHRELSLAGKVSLLNLSRRMVKTFCTGICGLTDQKWEKFPAGDAGENVRIFTRENQFRGSPCVLVSAVGSVWMPVEPDVMFGLLCDERRLDIWEHLRQGGEMHEMVRLARGTEPGNRVSVFARDTSCAENKMLVVQEICNDASGSLIIHAPVDGSPGIAVMNGGDSSSIDLLPSGFTVLPGCYAGTAEAVAGKSEKPREEGCVLTAGFQIVAGGSAKESVTEETVKTIKQIVSGTIQKVENALPVNLGLGRG